MSSSRSLIFAIAILFSSLIVAAEYTSDAALAPLAGENIDVSVSQKIYPLNDNDELFLLALALLAVHILRYTVATADCSFVAAQFANSPPIRSPPAQILVHFKILFSDDFIRET